MGTRLGLPLHLAFTHVITTDKPMTVSMMILIGDFFRTDIKSHDRRSLWA